MKVDNDTWLQKMNNLLNRRSSGVNDNRKCEPIISDYKRHLRSITLGKKILDVGCGDQSIKGMLPFGKHYLGIDPFPISEGVIKMKIEDCDFIDQSFDTVLCFAVLDGCQDIEKATSQMKRIASDNVVFLTGVDIEPDEYHTHKITKEELDKLMVPFQVRMRNFLSRNVMLVEYSRK